MNLGEVLISEAEIARAVRRIADEIAADYAGRVPLLVGVMDGAVCFLSDLMRALPGTVEVATARASSYAGTKPGEIAVGWLPKAERVAGQHALLVDDIVDTGATAALLSQRLTDMGAASARVCALLDKPSRREREVEVAYSGFEIPDVFVVGYGLDYDGAYRNLWDVRGVDARSERL